MPATAKSKLSCLQARASSTDPERAADELAERIGQPGASVVLYFATPDADMPGLARAMEARFGCPTIGCTTAGEITAEHGHEQGTIVAASIASARLRVHSVVLGPEDLASAERLRVASEGLLSRLELGLGPDRCFAMSICDGLSMREERLAAGVAGSLGGIPMVGGSAGDGLAFESTMVALDGHAASGCAVLSLVETDHPFETFKSHHFAPTESRLVITAADPETRRVHEINGEPAAAGYAKAIGIEPERLSPEVYSAHPVMLRVGGRHYVRSIQRANDDGSLTFYCAIDNGLVLRVGEGRGLTTSLEEQVRRIRERVPGLAMTIGFDCVLRRLELMEKGLRDEAARLVREARMFGFSTYGEQINGLHVNQTFTGVALGEAA